MQWQMLPGKTAEEGRTGTAGFEAKRTFTTPEAESRRLDPGRLLI
jgi:hypothetical protein